MSIGNIKDKFIDPFGPYVAPEILDHNAIRRHLRDKFFLESVVFRQGANNVGIDDFDNGRFGDGSDVLFRGILTIADKRWLNETGKNWLQNDVDSRAGASYLKLDDCFKNYNVKVLIQDRLGAIPRYLMSTNDLRVFSFRKTPGIPDATFEYIIMSMDVYTYSRSRKFFSKYRALHTIMTIAMTDNELPKANRTPLQGRTPKWLVDRYLQVNLQRFKEERSDPSHTPRHIHRSEVYAVFGRHAKWLSETIKKNKLLNYEAWQQFSLEMASRRRKGVKPEEVDQLQDWAEFERIWDEPAAPDSPPEQDDHEELEYVSTHESDAPVKGSKSRSISPEPNYDHLNADNVSGGVEQRTVNFGESDVLATIPTFFYREQPVLQRNMTWFCPVATCSFSLDFLCLPKSVLGELDKHSRDYLCSFDWKVDDEEFIELFYDIVERHYFMHLEDYGVKVMGFGSEEVDIFDRPIAQERRITAPRDLRSDDNPKFKWIKPHNHKPAFYYIHSKENASNGL